LIFSFCQEKKRRRGMEKFKYWHSYAAVVPARRAFLPLTGDAAAGAHSSVGSPHALRMTSDRNVTGPIVTGMAKTTPTSQQNHAQDG
jgi:hypothetical protein